MKINPDLLQIVCAMIQTQGYLPHKHSNWRTMLDQLIQDATFIHERLGKGFVPPPAPPFVPIEKLEALKPGDDPAAIIPPAPLPSSVEIRTSP